MSSIIKVICAGLVAGAALITAGNATAADLSPGYVGADVGLVSKFSQDHGTGRVYAGYTLGTTTDFGLENVHAIELMAYSVGARSNSYGYAYSAASAVISGRDQL